MSNIVEIERAIERLSPAELLALRAWFAQRDAAGKPDALADGAIGASGEGRRKAFNEWMALARQRANRYPPGFVADDSRESIYAGRGE
jgi:hypothetical protein